jgi:hypothetical protein
MRYFKVSLLAIALLSINGLGYVTAQTNGDTIGLSISPAISEIAGDRGTNHTTQTILKNTSNKAIPVTVDVTSLIPIEDEIDRARRAEFDASSWVKVDKTKLILEPGEAVPINAEVSIPAEANPGGHYAQIGFRVAAEARTDQNANAQIIPEVAAALFITVPGDVNEYAELITNNLVPSYVTKNSKVELNFSIRNTGNVHILPVPKVTIFNKEGDIKQIAMQPQLVLPNTQKNFTVEWPADVPYGQYQARVEMVYGSENIPLSNPATDFKVGPAFWQVGLVAALTILGIFLLIRSKNLPRALKVLSGKRVFMAKKHRYSYAENEAKTPKHDPKADKEFSDIGQLVSDTPTRQTRPIKLTTPVYTPSAVPVEPVTPTPSQVVKVVAIKQPETPIKQVPIAPKVTVTEFAQDAPGAPRTIVVQTAASTIIRQETIKTEPVEAQPVPTIVRIKIPDEPEAPDTQTPENIADAIDGGATPPPPVKPKIKSRPQLTRWEQTEAKAKKARKKATRKKT